MSDLSSIDLRSLAFYARLASDPSLYGDLSPEQRRALGEGLRDRFFALSAGRAGKGEEEALFRAAVSAIDAPPVVRIDGLSLSSHPTARFQAVRFLEAEQLEAELRPLFARPSAEMPQLLAVFVDPEELSYRTFENIVPLDRLFERTPLQLSLEHRDRLDKRGDLHAYTFAIQASEATAALLASLDGLELYVPPLNAGARGGKRFIFHSALLSQALTEAFREALPKSLAKGFSHVNPVFRCNRFEPGDEKFHAHLDTPYFDAARSHVSRYTVLLYLTGGSAQPVLQLGDAVSLEAIAPMTAVIFHQRCAHEGQAYTDGRKVFLRTELVFEEDAIAHEPKIAQLFSKACYLTGESLFAPELERYARDYYDRAALAHWQGLPDRAAESEPFVHKQFRDVHFVSNGYDYWFPARALSLKEAAALALLDHFNCVVGGEAFRKRCAAEVLRGSAHDAARTLAPYNAPLPEPLFFPLDKEVLFPPSEDPDDSCCPFHYHGAFDATRCDEIIELYERAQTFARARILPAPIWMMGQEIFLDPDKFVIQSNQIHVLANEALAPVNFASCWNYGGSPANYLDVDATVDALHLLVPPLLFVERDGCWHLMLDFFRNSWMVDPQPQRVPVPKIRDIDPSEAEEQGGCPWIDAVPAELVSERRPNRRGGPWWGDDPLVQELYDYRREEEDEE